MSGGLAKMTPGRLVVLSFFFILMAWICTPSGREREAADRKARPEYYAHIDKFGEPLSMNEVIGDVGTFGFDDLDISHIKGPLLVPDGWLFGLVFKCRQNPNDQLWWFVQTGKRGVQDLIIYPGNKYPIPAYP